MYVKSLKSHVSVSYCFSMAVHRSTCDMHVTRVMSAPVCTVYQQWAWTYENLKA